MTLLVKIAGLQTSFVTLDEVIKVTSRRVNALENVVIPRIEWVIDYIKRELEEEEREDFFRRKKVQDSKKRRLEKERIQREAENLPEPESVLDVDEFGFQQKDEDIIF